MNSETRIAVLEVALTNHRVESAQITSRLSEAVEHLEQAVTSLSTSVSSLKSTMDKGSGALWVIIGISSGAGALLTAGISKLLERGS